MEYMATSLVINSFWRSLNHYAKNEGRNGHPSNQFKDWLHSNIMFYYTIWYSMMRDGRLSKLCVVYDVDGYKPLSALFYILYIYEQCMIYTTKGDKIKFLPTPKVTKFSLGNNHMTVSLPLLHHTTWHFNLPNTGTPAEHNSCSASRLRHVCSSICFSVSNAQ